MGQATTTGDEGGDKYGTQRPTSEADEDWRPEHRASDESHGSDTDSSSTTNSSSGGMSSTSSESSSDGSSSDSSAKVAPHEAMTRNGKRDETYVWQDWAPCEAPSSVLGRAEEKPSMGCPGGVGGYNHHCIGEEVEWRPPLLYANPLGHRIPATPDM